MEMESKKLKKTFKSQEDSLGLISEKMKDGR